MAAKDLKQVTISMKRLFYFTINQQRSPSVQGSTADIADTHPNDTDTDLETTTNNNNNGTGNNLATDSSSSLINSPFAHIIK